MKLSPSVGGAQTAVDGFLGISPPKTKTEDNIQPKKPSRNSDFRERLRIQHAREISARDVSVIVMISGYWE